MKLRRVFAGVLGILVCSAVRLHALECDAQAGERRFPPSSCITFESSSTLTNSNAHTSCSNGGLVTLEADGQFETLSRYVEVLLQGGSPHWLGYMYNSSGVLLTVPGQVIVSSPSPLLEPSNYDTTGQQVAIGDGVCIAIGVDSNGDAKLYRRMCDSALPYICAQAFTAPSITSLTSNVNRFLIEGTVVLTCSASNYEEEIEWRQNGVVVSPGTPGLTIDNAANTLTVQFNRTTDNYECSVGNRAGSVVSESVVLDSSGGAVIGAPSITSLSTSADVQLGLSVNITCSFTTTNNPTLVEWFFNGQSERMIPLAPGQLESVWSIKSFSTSEDGVYQCRLFNENNDNSIQDVLIMAAAGTPGPIESPIARADSQTAITISWLYPLDHNDLDPLLLRFDILYNEGNTFNEATAQRINNIVPLLVNGEISTTDYQLRTLNPGTDYMVTVRASSSGSQGAMTGNNLAFVTTYGNAPSVTVDNLKVLRTKDNKTLFADWDDLKTTPPVGPVVRYRVQYRDSGKGANNTVILAAKYSYLVVTPVENAQNYQVRVCAGVIISRDPVEYQYGPYTKWLEVQGITDTVPPIPPAGVLPVASVIAVSVIVPVLVVGLITFILIVGLVCCCVQKNKSDGFSPRKRLDSQAAKLKPEESSELEKELKTVV